MGGREILPIKVVSDTNIRHKEGIHPLIFLETIFDYRDQYLIKLERQKKEVSSDFSFSGRLKEKGPIFA